MNTKLHTDGSFQAMRQAIDDARQAFADGGADHHRDALHLGRVVMNSLAEIIETDGGTDGPTASPQDIEDCYQRVIDEEEVAEPDNAARQSTHGTMNLRQQGVGR